MITPATIALATATATAAVGAFVAYQAYRGYRRNGSRRMGALAVAIVCIAVPPAAVHGVALGVPLTDAQAIVAILFFHTVGLAVLYASLR
jgi:cytochrome bd-type quinol oxidase subunit 1